MLASARHRACAVKYRLPAAARLRAICRAGDLARRAPRAAASSPGGRERPPYILRQTNGKSGNGRPPQSPRNEFCFRQKLYRATHHPCAGADDFHPPAAGPVRRDPACLLPPACGQFVGRARSPALHPQANVRQDRKWQAGAKPAQRVPLQAKTVPSHTPLCVEADDCIRPPPGLCGGIPLARRRPPAGDL